MVESTGRDDPTHRAIEILEILHRLNGSARTTHLADAMGVSEETVRRTVKKLSKKGIVARVHGGVYLTGEVQEPSFFHRIGKRSREKRRIAKAAVAASVARPRPHSRRANS